MHGGKYYPLLLIFIVSRYFGYLITSFYLKLIFCSSTSFSFSVFINSKSFYLCIYLYDQYLTKVKKEEVDIVYIFYSVVRPGFSHTKACSTFVKSVSLCLHFFFNNPLKASLSCPWTGHISILFSFYLVTYLTDNTGFFICVPPFYHCLSHKFE